MDNKKIYSLLLRLIGLVVFTYILLNIDFKLFFEKICGADAFYLAAGFILTLGVLIAKSLRWRSILGMLGIAIGSRLSIKLYWLGLYAGIMTPGKLGEVVKVYFLKHKGFSGFRSLMSVIIDRASDVFVIMVSGLFVVAFYMRDLAASIIIVLTAAFCGLIFYVFFRKGAMSAIADGILKRILNAGAYGRYRSVAGSCSDLGHVEFKRVGASLFYLILSWGLYFLANYAIALSIGIKISPFMLLAVITAATIASILPISIAGLGTRDASIIYIFALTGLSKESAVVFSFFILIIDLIVISFGLIPYLKESVLVAETKQIGVKAA